MQKHLTAMEAWDDFYDWMAQRKKNGEFARIPADVQEAHYASKGLRDHKLGAKRIAGLLTKYAPERYQVETTFILLEDK